MKRARHLIIVVLALPVVAVAGTVFRLNLPVLYTPAAANLNWVSLPYFYFPNGNVGQTPQTARDLCTALNGAPQNADKIARASRWLPSLVRFESHLCNSPLAGFNLVPGEGYALVPNAPGVTIPIVGTHDPNYAPNLGGTSRVPLSYTVGHANLNWISIPYTVRADTALDLCLMINNGPNNNEVTHVVRHSAGRWTVQDCLALVSAFDLLPGEAYGFVPAGPGRSVAFDVYNCGYNAFAVQSGSNVYFAWPPDPAASTYDIFRSETRQDICSPLNLIGSTPLPEFEDIGAMNHPALILYYGETGR